MDFHILSQAILYFCICTAGLVLSISFGVNRSNFNGECILYADVTWDSRLHFTAQFSNHGNCNFPIYYSVFGMLFYGLGMGLFYSYATSKSMRSPSIGSQMWSMPYILLNGAQAFMTLIVSCMLSVGFLQFCNGIEESDFVERCDAFVNKEWTMTVTGEQFNAGPYTSLLAIAQYSSWICLLMFLLQMGLCILRVMRNRRQRTSAKYTTGIHSDKNRIAELEPSA